MEIATTPHKLIRRLLAAFAPVPYPGDDRIITFDCPASRQLRNALRACPPSAVPDALIVEHYDGLSFMSAAARRYYLPAFVRTALRRPESDVAEFLLYSLGGDLGWQLNGGFTASQRAAVVAYLEFLPQCMDAIFREQIADALARWQVIIPLAHAA